MELWIRSQDKEELVKADNIRIQHEYKQKEVKDNYGRISAYINGNYMKSMICSNSIWVGEYKTKERALEVLDDIQRHIDLMYMDNKLFNKVYEMPKE